MRMWNIEPSKLCRNHLLGEHFEIHKAIGNLKNSRKWTESLAKKGYLEPQNALKRHNKLVEEMKKRGYKHNSKLKISGIKLPKGKVDIKKSIRDLKKRCKFCFSKIKIK